MINLLPPGVVRELRAARTNTSLRVYLMTSMVASVLVVGMIGGALYINQQQYQLYKQQRQESQQALVEVQKVKQRIADYNNSLKAAEAAYEAEIKMTNLVANLSSTLPPGAILNTVSLDVLSFTEPVTITAQVDTFEKAGVLKRNFEQSQFFSEVTLQRVSEAAGGEVEGEPAVAYPFTATLEVALTPEAAKGIQPEEPEGEAL